MSRENGEVALHTDSPIRDYCLLGVFAGVSCLVYAFTLSNGEYSSSKGSKADADELMTEQICECNSNLDMSKLHLEN